MKNKRNIGTMRSMSAAGEEQKPPAAAVEVVDLCSPPPTARIKADVKLLEESEDCFVLDFDPYEPAAAVDGGGDQAGGDDDVSIVAEKGKIASRDYPHARYLCPRHPFETTRHALHCKMCYCYVCDTAAPCEEWNVHCDAHDTCGFNWRNLRRNNLWNKGRRDRTYLDYY